jgi:IS5 family transposase
MFKILILQAWYALSDEALEKQIARDLMFRRFIDLSLSEAVPDHSIIWRFRQLLNTENLLEALLEQINHHLEQNSIIVSLGSINIIDATVIEAKQSRKRKGRLVFVCLSVVYFCKPCVELCYFVDQVFHRFSC